MVVSPDFADGVIYDFKEKSKEIIDVYSLTHLRGTAAMDPVSRLGEEFIKLAQGSSTNQNITESMLESEKRLYLKTIEEKVLEISRQQGAALNGLTLAQAAYPPVQDANWDKTITSVAIEVDRIAVKNADLMNMLSKEEQEVVDQMFSRVIDRVRFAHSSDPSANNAQVAEKTAVKELRAVESHLEKVSRQALKTKQEMIYADFNEQLQRYLQSFSQLRNVMKPAEIKATNDRISSIKSMMREIKTNRRLVSNEDLLRAHIGTVQEQFRILNEMEGRVSETVSAVAGIFGSTHRRSNKKHFALDGFGQVPVTDQTAASHTIRENSDLVKGITSTGFVVGGGTLFILACFAGLIVATSR